MFHLVSLSLQISLTDLPGSCLGLCVCCFFVVLVGLVVGFFLWGKLDLNHRLIPVVDRPCLALVRQCRKKKWRFNFGNEGFWFDFWRFILGAKVSVLISGNLHLERLFIWVSGRV